LEEVVLNTVQENPEMSVDDSKLELEYFYSLFTGSFIFILPFFEKITNIHQMDLIKIHIYIPLFILLLLYSCENRSDADHSEITIDQGTNMAVALSPSKDKMVIDVLGQLWLLDKNGGNVVALTDGLGNARQPDWSPDGQSLLFQAYWEGNWHIYILNLESKEISRITSGSFDHREPVWSPDGESIVFSSDLEGSYDLYIFNFATGSMVRQTTDDFNEFAPDWSPDGQRIVYASDNPSEKGIRELNKDSGEDRLLLSTDQEVRGISYAPSGKGISYVTLSFQSTTLNYLDFSSSEHSESRLSGNGQDIFPFRAQWIDDTNYLITANGNIQQRSINDTTIQVIPFNASIPINRSTYQSKSRSFESISNLPVSGIAWPDLSPDGNAVALISIGDLWVVSSGIPQRLTDDNYLDMLPEWSPDGQQIAYISDKSGAFDLYLMDLRTGISTNVTTLPGTVSGLAWSKDGSKIAYSTSFGPRLGRAGYVDIGSGELVNVTSMMTSSLGAPTWSPDDESICFSMLQPFSSLYREGVNGIVRYDLEGQLMRGMGQLDSLSIGVRAKDGPVWSPDGKWIAVVSSGKLLLIPLDSEGQVSGEIRKVDDGPTDVPSWSNDGHTLSYLSGNQILVYDINSGSKTALDLNLQYDRSVPSGEKVIQCGTFFSATNDDVIQDIDIFISKNRIISITPRDTTKYKENIEIVDAKDAFVMPGLIDCHSHQGSWGGKKLGQAWLSWGVTSTRDPASDPYDALNRREGMESGDLISPRIFFTGSPIDGSRIYYGGASTHLDTMHIARELEKARILDYDMIKTYVRLPDPLQKWVAKRAHDLGIPVSSHELYPAVAYGVDGVEHILGTSRRGYSPKMSHLGLSYSDVTDLIAQSGMSFTPTTGIYSTFNYLLAENPSLLDDDRLDWYSDPFSIDNARRGISQVRSNQREWTSYFNNTLKMVYDIHKKGGHVVAGTDSPIIPYGFSLHLELMAYNRAGLSNVQVLRSATERAAETIGVSDHLGTLEEGKLADILILRNNPLKDITHTMDVEMIIINGEVYTQETIYNK
jgi:Tol biopolymer transport system component